jgi:Putative transposase/Transposase zinc-binding domain
VIPLAEVLRRHGPAYARRFGAKLLPSHRRAVQSILQCRTPALGGQIFRCDCGQVRYVYHSCNHRACPRCGHADATQWLARQRQKLLPVPYYLVTFTVPAQLRRLIRSHQQRLYSALLRESARALQDVARDHKDFGARIGLLAVLQTWTRDLRFHPHVHCVVPAGGLSPNGRRWVRPRHPDYFLPQLMLARRFRTRFQAVLKNEFPEACAALPTVVWTQDWVVDVQPVGSGEPALKYLAAYVYRTAVSAERILADDGQRITFTYRDGPTRQTRTVSLPADVFLHRFLQHVLPRGFQRVRSFGFLSPAAKERWDRILALLDWQPPAQTLPEPTSPPLCPGCHKPMILLGQLPRPPP